MSKTAATFTNIRCILLLVSVLFVSGCFGGVWVGTWRSSLHLQEAEEATRAGSYQEAIDSYERHIDHRLGVEDRPSWENPHFYLLAIGDLYLRLNDQPKALASYESAEAKGVDPSLVSDRYRYVASWYEERGEDLKAQELLLRFRDRDPLLFNAMLDRIAKKIVQAEESSRKSADAETPGPPTPTFGTESTSDL
jgi:tetratricopeptide (TPR) repeat protein